VSHDHPTPETGSDASGVEAGADGGSSRAAYYLRVTVYSLGVVLALALLSVGSVAIIAELKGTWHWQLHLETTVSYMAVFIGWVLAALVPLSVVLGVVRLREGA
jgi:hypothetical protein